MWYQGLVVWLPSSLLCKILLTRMFIFPFTNNLLVCHCQIPLFDIFSYILLLHHKSYYISVKWFILGYWFCKTENLLIRITKYGCFYVTAILRSFSVWVKAFSWPKICLELNSSKRGKTVKIMLCKFLHTQFLFSVFVLPQPQS